jgi:type II secretory pathway pseudopilin PulG
VVIVGILTAAILPCITRSREANTAKSAVSVIGGDVEAAFAAAARSRHPMLFRCTCTSYQYEVADQTDGSIKLSRRLDASSNLIVDQLTLSPTSIVIGPNGIASAASRSPSAWAQRTAHRRSRTGQVRIIKETESAWFYHRGIARGWLLAVVAILPRLPANASSRQRVVRRGPSHHLPFR